MKIKSIIIVTVLILGFDSKDVLSQPKMGITAGYTYMTNEFSYYSSRNGKNLDVYYYPLSISGVEVGVSVGYKARGYMNESIPLVWINPRQSPLEYVSFSIPIRKSFNIGNSIDVLLKLGVRYETPIFDKRRFQPNIGFISFDDIFGFSIGTGLNLKSIYPNLILDISYNPDLMSFVGDSEIGKLSSLEFKVGIQFDGFK